MTKPDENVGRIGPKEGTHLRRHPDRIIHAESLQSLNVKRAVVVITGGAFLPVNTLPLAKRLPSHDSHHISSRRIARNTEPLIKERRGKLLNCEL